MGDSTEGQPPGRGLAPVDGQPVAAPSHAPPGGIDEGMGAVHGQTGALPFAWLFPVVSRAWGGAWFSGRVETPWFLQITPFPGERKIGREGKHRIYNQKKTPSKSNSQNHLDLDQWYCNWCTIQMKDFLYIKKGGNGWREKNDLYISNELWTPCQKILSTR